LLREAADAVASGEWDGGDLVTLEPDGEGNYQVSPAPDEEPRDLQDVAGGVEDHRQLGFLEAGALLRAR